MSTPREPTADNSPRVAIGEELRANWDPDESAGYEIDDTLGLGLGFFDEDLPMPQIALTSVSSTARGNNGRVAWDATGAGFIQEYLGRTDLNIHVGTVDDVKGEPSLLAKTIGNHARDILHDANGLIDPGSDELLCSTVTPLSRPRINVSTDGAKASYRAIVEAQHRIVENPPK